MAGKVCMVMALIMIGCVLQACNGANVDESQPTQDPKFDCFRTCSIACGKQNKPCYDECLTKCGLPQRLPRPTTSSSPSSTAWSDLIQFVICVFIAKDVIYLFFFSMKIKWDFKW